MARLFADTSADTSSSTVGLYGGLVMRSNASDRSVIEFVNNNSSQRQNFISVTNTNALFNADITAYSTTITSDIKIKENIKDLDNSLKKILCIRGVTYNRKNDENKKTHIGVIAQEIEKILPEVISESDDPTDITSENKIKTVAYTEIIPVLIEAIKEQHKIIEDLKARIEILEKN